MSKNNTLGAIASFLFLSLGVPDPHYGSSTTDHPLPDNVFKEGYTWSSLDEVPQHLPGIPSEQKINAKGVSIGEMPRLQMAKIEELTLYWLEEKARNRTREEQVDGIFRENEALHARFDGLGQTNLQMYIEIDSRT